MDVRQNYDIYSLGANSYGQLGLNSIDDHLIPQKIGSFLGHNEIPSLIAGGGGHTAVLTGSGALYVCGWNACGQLGIGSRQNAGIFQKLVGVTNIKHVACGWNHTLFVADTGKCYSFGSNAFDQLGCSKNKMELLPIHIQGIPGIVKTVAAGMRHSVALTEDGVMYAWGCGKKGQLGLSQESIARIAIPTRVQPVEGVRMKDIKAGAEFSAALSVCGDVYCWGYNLHGQCGLPGRRTASNDGTAINQVSKPTKINFPSNEKIASIHLGWSHVIAMTECKKIFAWGRGDYGQLGGGHCESRSRPTELHFGDKGVESFSGGSEHNLAINCSSQLLAWGWNEHGMCATGDEDNVLTPRCIPVLHDGELVLTGCGAGTSFLCLESKRNMTT